jgi:hypothetical protein
VRLRDICRSLVPRYFVTALLREQQVLVTRDRHILIAPVNIRNSLGLFLTTAFGGQEIVYLDN